MDMGKEDWLEPPPQKVAPAAEPKAAATAPKMDDFEAMLADYDRRKQQEAERIVKRALEIETARTKGAEALKTHVLPHAREVVNKLRQSGHRVVYQESLEHYPPNIRVHLYPKLGPMDVQGTTRWTLEMTWGDPQPDRLFATRWTSTGLADMVDLGSAGGAELDQLWVREQFLDFVRHALDLS
jgi:hypothetical protein